jgi:hypothetical protein
MRPSLLGSNKPLSDSPFTNHRQISALDESTIMDLARGLMNKFVLIAFLQI